MWVIVNHSTNSIDKLNDDFCCIIAWSSFASDHDYSWHEFVLSLSLGRVLNCQVSVHHVQDVHKLSLVLVYALHLDVVKCIERDHNAGSLLNIFLQLSLVSPLDFEESIDEILIGCVLI